MCFGSPPVLGIVPALFSLSPLLTETPFSVFLSLSENQLCTTPSMQSSSCCPSYHLPAPPGPAPLARHAGRNTGRLPRTGLELGGNSGKSNILAHLSLAKNTGSRAILRDGGMGKLCLESWVPASRQGCQADVGRGTQCGPGAEGTALGRRGAGTERGWHCRDGRELSAMQTGAGYGQNTPSAGPGAAPGFCGTGSTRGSELGSRASEHSWSGSVGRRWGSGLPWLQRARALLDPSSWRFHLCWHEGLCPLDPNKSPLLLHEAQTNATANRTSGSSEQQLQATEQLCPKGV